MNRVEVYNFKEYDEMGKYLREITNGGADVVIDCVGMDGKNRRLKQSNKNSSCRVAQSAQFKLRWKQSGSLVLSS